jgi:hypothetical protein
MPLSSHTNPIAPRAVPLPYVLVFLLGLAGAVSAQESPAPAPVSPPPAARSVRISFLPPPLEGTISLGIYNEWDQLVRVLHQEAGLDEFTVGADALTTKWDGKNDDGQDLPAGKYQAHGYLVGNLKVENIGNQALPPGDWNGSPVAPIKLMANPLAKDERPILELAVGFDDENSFLQTTDGLPLYTIAPKPNVRRACIKKSSEKSADVWEDDGLVVEQLRVSNLDKMMAFDCGEFELR